MIETILLDYVRFAGYAVVIISSLNGIAKKKFSNILFVGDILVAFGLMTIGLLCKFGEIDRNIAGQYILTPAIVLWAIIHFSAMVKPATKK